MKSTTFVRIICAISICGLAINSSCAPDTKRRTPVNRTGGPGGAGGDGGVGTGVAPRIATVSKTMDAEKCANGQPLSIDADKLQSRIEAVSKLGTAITFAQLPKGRYFLTKVVATIQANNLPEVGSFSLYREATVSPTGGDEVNERCDDFVVAGKVPQNVSAIDVGRTQNVDSFFVVGDKGLIDSKVVSIRFKVGVPAANSQIGIFTIEKAEAEQQLPERAQKRLQNANRRQNRTNTARPVKLPSLMKQLARKDVRSNKILDATSNGQFDATSDIQLFKLNETEYVVAITYHEKGNVDVTSDRKIILTYSVASEETPQTAGRQGAPAPAKAGSPRDAGTDQSAAAPAPVTTAPAPVTATPPPTDLQRQADEAAAAFNPNTGAPGAAAAPGAFDGDHGQ